MTKTRFEINRFRRARFSEARDGNFNAKARTRVLKFLKELGRDDIFILDKESNFAVVWTVDCGKVDLIFSFEGAMDSYSITARDSNKEKIETWSGEYGELQMDLEDTVEFIDEFKGSLNASSAPKTEAALKARKRIAEAKLRIAKKKLKEVYAADKIADFKALVSSRYPAYTDLVDPYLEEIGTVGEPDDLNDMLPDFVDYSRYILGESAPRRNRRR